MFHDMMRCGKVALVGRPNVGKSTLLNALVGERLAIVSPKPQSTRQPTDGLRTDEDAQFLFVDAPGLLEPEYQLQEVMHAAARRTIAEADVIAYLHPLADAPAPSLTTAGRLARAPRAPIVTAYTKADLVAPAARRALGPDELVVSAVSGEGLGELVARLRAALPEGPFLYDPEALSTQPLRHFAAEFVREAALERLGAEVPYSVHVEVDEFREGEDPVYVRAIVYVERESQKGIVIGDGGRQIGAIGRAARSRIEELLGQAVYLDLWVKVLPKWRRRADTLNRLGFS
jgi:GTP-binding protein Era